MFVFKAAVVGAGVTGGEIAQVIAAADIPVLLKDVDETFVDAGLEKAREVTREGGGQARREGQALRGGGRRPRSTQIARPDHGTTGYDGFGDVDFAIEADAGEAGAQAPRLRGARRGDARSRDPRLQHRRSSRSPRSARSRCARTRSSASTSRRAARLVEIDRGRRHLARDAAGRRQLRAGGPQDRGALRRVPGLRRRPRPRLGRGRASAREATRLARRLRRPLPARPDEPDRRARPR